MSELAQAGLAFGLAVALGLLVPALFMKALAPSLERGRRVPNYRGREVYPGLGVIWLVWAGCAIVCGIAASSVSAYTALFVLWLLGPLALAAFAFGLIDDAYGNGDDRGFRGHFRALAHGRMTTGMLKLIGIGAAAFAVALTLSTIAPWGSTDSPFLPIVGVLFAAASIALTTNLVNLTDLRPGRALKVYSILAIGGVLLVPNAMVSAGFLADAGTIAAALDMFALAVAVLGPVIAVWRYDLGERGMLGDAGANAMGAVAGALIVLGLPFWGLVAYTVVIFGLNAASERVSFSAVIERTPALRWLDSLGRVRDEETVPFVEEGPTNSETTAGARPETAGSRYDSQQDTNDRKA